MCKTINLAELTKVVNGKLIGNPDTIICGINGIENVTENEITFADTSRHFKNAMNSDCSAVMCIEKIYSDKYKKDVIIVEHPKLAFAKVQEFFSREPIKQPGISNKSSISDSVKLGKNIFIGANAVIDDNTEIGDNSIIYPNVYIGERVKVGKNVKIYPGVSIYYDTIIGDNCIFHSNAVIGADGFGYAMTSAGHYKVPQTGNVIIGDNVEIGALVAIDRATNSSTIVGNGVKLDDHVHLAHNVQIGNNTLIISKVSIAGSSKIGSNCIIAGHAAIRDHIEIGDNVIVIGKSGVTKNIKPNQIVSGFPAKPHNEEKKLKVSYMKMPETIKTVNQLNDCVKRLQKRIDKFEQ